MLIELQEDNASTLYQNSNRRYTIFWEARKGIILSNRKRQSPAVRLEHEFDHAMDDIDNHKNHESRNVWLDNQYDNGEERRVITGSEAETARKLGQGIRYDHYGTAYLVKDPRFLK